MYVEQVAANRGWSQVCTSTKRAEREIFHVRFQSHKKDVAFT